MSDCEVVKDRPVMIPVRPLLVGNSPALAAAELGPTDCTSAPDETLRALATWSVDSCKAKLQHIAVPYTCASTHKLAAFACFSFSLVQPPSSLVMLFHPVGRVGRGREGDRVFTLR